MVKLLDIILTKTPLPDVPRYWYQYIPGQTPLSTTPVVLGTLAAYLVTIFSIQAFMKDRAPFTLTTLFRLHNAFLTIGSGLLLVFMVEEVAGIVQKDGPLASICATSSWTPRLETFYMINYAFKYIELIDTVFLALKKKPLAFLHVFHHSATALLCFTQLNGKTSVSWVVISLNLAVHVIMYYYYYATAGGARIWWKKYLTSMQITQFVIDLFIVYFATYAHFAYKYFPQLPNPGDCAGAESSAWLGCGLLTSYLGLFIKFYFDTYKNPKAKGKTAVNGNGVAKRK